MPNSVVGAGPTSTFTALAALVRKNVPDGRLHAAATQVLEKAGEAMSAHQRDAVRELRIGTKPSERLYGFMGDPGLGMMELELRAERAKTGVLAAARPSRPAAATPRVAD